MARWDSMYSQAVKVVDELADEDARGQLDETFR